MRNYLEKETDLSFLLRVYVKTNARKQEIIENGETLLISLRAKPIQNKANRELIGLLKKKLQISTNQVQIISGLKSTNKVIKLEFLEYLREEDIVNKIIN